MQALKRTWFISDLHLDAAHHEISSQFIKLMNSCDVSVDAVYILGDLFEVWIGDDDPSPFIEEMAAALIRVTCQGTPVYLMHGNRDFLIGRQFLAKTGCQMLGDEETISLYGTPVLLMHGDTLCTQDIAYLRARKLAHNKILQFLFLALPISFRLKLAAKARNASEKHTSTTEKYVMDVTQSEVERVMHKHQVNYLIHGHTHRPDTHHFTAENQQKTRIVLPAWHGGGSVFEWREDDVKQLIPLA
jgi:UDP-2,3-diacylglucosamine hydrolase